MPRGTPKKAKLAAPKTEMVKMTLELPPQLYARVARAATNDERTPNVFVRRFLALNVDVFDPDGAEASE